MSVFVTILYKQSIPLAKLLGASAKNCLTRWVEWASGVERASCPLQFPGGLSQPSPKRGKITASRVVRYGADYPNPGAP
ncbi:MAG: hypothetical protein F6K26_50420 [Moorea sp. SIO2I5]|nr:hypothetical protein [Moorena sp. SIO2I5]